MEALLQEWRLADYAAALGAAGYAGGGAVGQLCALSPSQVDELVSRAGFKPGHAMKFKDRLQQLRAARAAGA